MYSNEPTSMFVMSPPYPPALPGAMDAIAQITDPSFVWSAATAPPAGHPLSATGSEVYVLESHRDSDLDRVLVFTSP